MKTSDCAPRVEAAGRRLWAPSKTVEVEELTASHDAEVETFLDHLGSQSPAVLGYHYPFYRDMLVTLGVGTPVYLGARVGNDLVGVLPVFERQTEAGTSYCSLPFFGPNAGVICADGSESEAIHAELLGHLLAKARENKALSCAVYTPLLFSEFSHYDALRPDAMVSKFTQHNSIENAQWNGFIRNRLRRAERLSITISTDNSPSRLDEFYEIYSENCSAYSIPLKPKLCIQKLLEPSVTGCRARIYYAFHDERMIGALLLVHSPSTVSYYIPCTRHEARNLQPGSLLVDRAFRDMRDAGVRIWNWESSPSRDSGVYQYKEKWGAIESDYRIYVWTFRGTDALKQIGSKQLASSFPYFFIYPFDQL